MQNPNAQGGNKAEGMIKGILQKAKEWVSSLSLSFFTPVTCLKGEYEELEADPRHSVVVRAWQAVSLDSAAAEDRVVLRGRCLPEEVRSITHTLSVFCPPLVNEDPRTNTHTQRTRSARTKYPPLSSPPLPPPARARGCPVPFKILMMTMTTRREWTKEWTRLNRRRSGP